MGSVAMIRLSGYSSSSIRRAFGKRYGYIAEPKTSQFSRTRGWELTVCKLTVSGMESDPNRFLLREEFSTVRQCEVYLNMLEGGYDTQIAYRSAINS